jgi:hypothetical protein
MNDWSSVVNIDGSTLRIELHVPRRELERNCEIVLLAEKVRMKPKSSANESSNSPRTGEPSFTKIKAELIAQWPFINSPGGPPGIGAKRVQESSYNSFGTARVLTQPAVLLSKMQV